MPELTKPIAPWDIDRNGVVNIRDLVSVANHFGEMGEGLHGDINGDSVVNVLDLVAVASHFGQTAINGAPVVTQHIHLAQLDAAFAQLHAKPNLTPGEVIVREFLRSYLPRRPTVPETTLFQNYPNPFNPETWIPLPTRRSCTCANPHLRCRRTFGAGARLGRTTGRGLSFTAAGSILGWFQHDGRADQ